MEENFKSTSFGYTSSMTGVSASDSLLTNLSFPNGTTTPFNNSLWSTPERIEFNEYTDSIEMIYKQTSMIQLLVLPPIPPETRVFKIVYSCIDGKWNKSEPIYGKINPPQDESYDFED